MSPRTQSAWFGPLLLVGSGACATTAERDAAVVAELAPHPFTADEIRRANPPKTVLVHRMEGADGAFIQTTSFLPSGDPERARIMIKRMTEQGSLLARPETSTVTWEELRDHASFPADSTTRTEDQALTPAGRFDCWLYTVRRQETGGPTIARFWFAFDEPGPPVIYETEQGGEIVSRMVLLENRRP